MSENTEEILDKYRMAGKIHAQLITESRQLVKPGLSFAEFYDRIAERTRELGGFSAFPTNISVNEQAAHSTAMRSEERVFDGNDVVKIDIGVHVDGYVADGAVTIDLSGKYGGLVKASEDALNAAIDTVKAGVSVREIGGVIEDTICADGFRPVKNLMGHGLDAYTFHDDPSVPNCRMGGDHPLRAGQVIAVEPFATDGDGFVTDGSFCEIYSQIRHKPTRSPFVRKVLEKISAYNGLPFSRRDLTDCDKLDMALVQLQRDGIVTGYPVLVEASGGYVAQTEHTLIVTEDGCEVTTARD